MYVSVISLLGMIPVLANKYSQKIESTDYLCVSVTDCTRLSLLISQFSQLLPLPPNLFHLKRVKSSHDKKSFSILLASPSLLSADTPLSGALEHIVPSLSAELSDSLGEVSVVRVPVRRPLTSVQCKEVKDIWPSVGSHSPQIEKQLNQPFSPKELSEMEGYMRAALRVATDPGPPGSPPIASVIVDPRTKNILAEFRHLPNSLDHSVILCIRQIAKTQVCTPVESRFKRKAGTDNISTDSYLCTGLELYTTQEPCIMCSMALVHARINKVVYGADNKEMGGLGSSYKIHCQEGINHHFQVFRGLLKVECEQLWC